MIGSILCPNSSGSGSSLSGGLLSDSLTSSASSVGAASTEAVQSDPSAPTLNLSIAGSLPPMPGHGHAAHHRPGSGGVLATLGHVGHDLVGWL
jgi:hypothetical protein